MTQYKGAFVMFLLALSSPAPAAAQDGGVFGRVVDQTGAVLPGSTVALSGPEGTRVTQSDGSGGHPWQAKRKSQFNDSVPHTNVCTVWGSGRSAMQ